MVWKKREYCMMRKGEAVIDLERATLLEEVSWT
jgi:hypothetical protein